VARQLVEAGERSSELARMTDRAAVLAETWTQDLRRRIAAVLDPLLMIVVGVFVLTVVLSILLPIFDLQAGLN
jgi:general secretion pathway protein F